MTSGKRQSESRGGPCVRSGHKFTDERWTAVDVQDWDRSREPHPHLCEDCQDRAIAAQKQAEADEHERQEQERLREQAEEEAPAQKAGAPASAPDPD
ncbi:hypothetical protein [Streptomyces sp. NPDC059371]|uniref:hypothetical protein n=1 Tax=Streptomyces sp. NPDC059371 TaxID=3346812 RepID=UPI003673D12A